MADPLTARMFPPTAFRAWSLALLIILLQLLFSGGLLWANTVAESAPGRQIARAALAEAGDRDPAALPDAAFASEALPAWRCCARTPLVFRTRLTEADARLSAPAVLVPSAHDNVWLYVDGDLIAGQGRFDSTVTSRRPQLLRIPDRYVHAGARIDLVVSRAIGFGHLRPFHVGEYSALYPSWQALRLLRSDLPLANAVIGAFVAAFCLCAAPLFGARGLLLSLGGLAGSWALQHVGLMAEDAPWGALANAGLYLWAFLATLVFLVWFFVEWTSVFAPPDRPPARTVGGMLFGAWSLPARTRLGLVSIAVIVLAVGLIALRLQDDPAVGLQDIDRIVGLCGLVAMAWCLLRLAAFYLRGGRANPLESSAFIFVLLAAAADIITVRFVHSYGIFLGPAATFFPLALLVSLAVRARGVFEAANATADKLNALVAEREGEILAGINDLRRREHESLLLEERARIMRDMHDGIGGQLLGLVMRARANRLTGPELVHGLEESLDDLRLVVGSLEQGDGSLATALGAYRARIEPRCEAAGATLVWQIEDVGETPGFGPDRTLQVYRILQEACTNALKHGRPDRIAVTLRRVADGRVRLSLEDNGQGFDPDAAPAGRGLANMRYRAGRIGGRILIESGPAGTHIALDMDADMTVPDPENLV